MPTKPSRLRLAPDVRPREYDLHLTPDLDAGTFRGEVIITTALAKPRKDVTLHAADLEITRAVAHVNGTREVAEAGRGGEAAVREAVAEGRGPDRARLRRQAEHALARLLRRVRERQ